MAEIILQILCSTTISMTELTTNNDKNSYKIFGRALIETSSSPILLI